MVTEQDLGKLRERVIHLEGQVAFLYKHLESDVRARSSVW